MYKPKVGDRVKVTVEGEVTYVGEKCFDLDDYHTYPFNVKVKKIKPPVEVFGPGDIVRRTDDDQTYAIGETGYLHLESGIVVPHEGRFTSERYTKLMSFGG